MPVQPQVFRGYGTYRFHSYDKMKSFYVRIFENNIESKFNEFSGQELQSIQDKLYFYFNILPENMKYIGSDDEELFIENTDLSIKINTKIQVTLSQYGVNPWGKVEFMFVEKN
jgi:hypothetical protein